MFRVLHPEKFATTGKLLLAVSIAEEIRRPAA
jgi:hypothetical protein